MYRKELIFSYTSFANTVNSAKNLVYILIDKNTINIGTTQKHNCNIIAFSKQLKYCCEGKILRYWD